MFTKNGEKPHKINKVELQKRINYIRAMIIDGYRRDQILEHIGKKKQAEWEVSESAVRKYYQKASDSFKTEFKEEAKDIAEKQVSRILEIYRCAKRDKNWQAANAAMKEINECFGLKKVLIELSGMVETDNKEIVKGLIDDYRRYFNSIESKAIDQQKSD